MISLLSRVPLRTLTQLALLLIALNAFVTGLGSVVRGAETSAFLPAAMLAGLAGWLLVYMRLKTGQGLGIVALLGVLFLWARTARLGEPLLLSGFTIGRVLLQNFLSLHGNNWFTASPSRAEVAIQGLVSQSAALWVRVGFWLEGLRAGSNVNDPVVRVLFWSLLLWLLAAWAGREVERNKPLEGLAPGLVLLAALTRYTNANASSLWLMVVSMLGLVGLSRFDANMRRWVGSHLDYAEVVATNTMFAGAFATLLLAVLGFTLPMVSVKDILESMRSHETAENQAARQLGLEAASQPLTARPLIYIPSRSPGLPNDHLLSGGPELSRDVVFTVKTGELPPIPVTNLNMLNIAQRHYWRSFSFDVYTGSGWVSSRVERIETPADQPLYDIPAGYQLLRQSFELKHGDEGSLYWSGILYRSNLPFEGAWRIKPGEAFPQVVDPFRGADLYGALNTSAAYSVESLIPQVSEERLRAAGRDIPDFIQQRYTSLPQSVPERVYALARDLTSTQPTSFDEARALESYLREKYPYTLDVPTPPLGVDVADYFLFDLKKGYCDYYATAMAVMARAVGLPARLVMGYASGTYNPQTAEYIVSAADAHAWVEIYFPGTGWVEFEPTAGLPAIHRPIRGVTNSAAEPPVVPVWERIVRRVYGMPVALRWIIFSLAGLLGMMVLFLFLESWLLGFVSPVFALRWIVRSLYRQAAHLAGTPSPGQTASEFSEGLQSTFKMPDNHLSLLTSLYLQAMFSPKGLNKSELTRAIRAWRSLRWKLLFTRKKKKTST